MNKKLIYLAIIISVVFAACGGDTSQTENTNVEEAAPQKVEVCTYSYNAASTGIYWTAFKHTQKVEVHGVMDSSEVVSADKAESPLELLKSIQINIYSGSVNSKDEGRDKKIREHFFGNMANTDVISGNIKSIEGDASGGTGILVLKLNDLEKEVKATYKIEGELVQLRCTVDFSTWDCSASLEALQKACEEKHTGEDGETVFWPDVKILVETTLDKECKEVI